MPDHDEAVRETSGAYYAVRGLLGWVRSKGPTRGDRAPHERAVMGPIRYSGIRLRCRVLHRAERCYPAVHVETDVWHCSRCFPCTLSLPR